MMTDVEVNFNKGVFQGVVHQGWFDIDVVFKNGERGYFVGVFDSVESVL